MKKTPYKHQIGTKKANFPEPTLAHFKKKLYLCTRKTQLIVPFRDKKVAKINNKEDKTMCMYNTSQQTVRRNARAAIATMRRQSE